ncbi:restriction endonuclease subunit S [Stenotrophomonas sp. YIM B06876]|uniref:restriction endonuclease subunit S n=1 Tax=Stenotrophomonas sp. YIM B06876 TaxID=3060211 RepID=UPI0027392762|nr:restriction endonuclease subunit S [Stenotrophomonas sp. YIM B06876]
MSDWVQGTLGDLITLQRGFDITKAAQSEGPYPVVSSGGIASFHDQFMAKGPGVVIGRKGTLGTAFFIPEDYWPHDTTLWVKDFKRNDEKFIYYLLKSIPLERLDSGSANPTLNRNYAHLLKVAAPRPAVQEKISAVLSTLDAKIDVNNRINAELEALAKTIYDYWFVQFDFPDANGRPYKSSGGPMVWNDTLKREIPAGWEVRTLGTIISRAGTGLNPRDHFVLGKGNNYYVTIKNVTNGRIFLDDKCDRIDDEAMAVIDRRSQLRAGDVLFTSIEPVGVTYLIQEKPTNWNINESVFTIRPDTDMVSSEYLLMLLSSSEMKVFTRNSSAGSIHKGIRHSVLKSFALAYPGRRLVDEFSSLLRPMLQKTDNLDKQNRELTRLRDWLLPLLMNGQVRVS